MIARYGLRVAGLGYLLAILVAPVALVFWRTFAQNGYRPVVRAAAAGFNFPVRPELFTIKWLGGWAKVDKRFFDPNTGIVTRIQRESGKS